jgi:hypothetical protein
MKETFYSNGKLLIGEYLVLDGGTAFALPTKFGHLIVEKTLIIKFTGKALTLTAKFEESISFSEIKMNCRKRQKLLRLH